MSKSVDEPDFGLTLQIPRFFSVIDPFWDIIVTV